MVGIEAELADFLRRLEHRLKDERKRDARGGVERLNDLCGILGNLPERFRAIEMLTAGDEPNFCGVDFHRELLIAKVKLLIEMSSIVTHHSVSRRFAKRRIH